MPVEMSDDEFESNTDIAIEFAEDEEDRENSGPREVKRRRRENIMTDGDLACLRKKFPFLADLSDKFVRGQTTGELLKMETTAIKMKMLESSRDHEDRLASNKMALEEKETRIPAASDNRWDKLHPARFLGGAACSAKKLWIEARKNCGMSGDKPIGSYDMGAVGMGGFVTSRGWVELHNPGSCKMSLKLFSINNCTSRVGISKNSNKSDDGIEDIIELGEFKLALRTLRVAAAMVMPWNFSYIALENFLIQKNFCSIDLQGLEQPARLLTQFVDYVLKENSNRWRDGSGFLDTGALKSTWDAFFGAKPQAQVKQMPKKQEQKSNMQQQQRRKWIDICFDWNTGKCLKPAGTCMSNKNTPLRHVCNFRPDRTKPDQYCEKNHTRTSFH